MTFQETPSFMMGNIRGYSSTLSAGDNPIMYTGYFSPNSCQRCIRVKLSWHLAGLHEIFFKLLKRQSVAPEQSGVIFQVMPYVLLGSMLLVAMVLACLYGNLFVWRCG